jgi:hypothetical protein
MLRVDRRQFLAGAGALLAASDRIGAAPALTSIEPLGMLVRECTLVGERRADDVVPAHPNGIQLSRDRWMILYATRGFRGVDDDLSIVYQLRADAPNGRVIREGHLARTRTDWDPLERGDRLIKQHGHPVLFGVPKGARLGGNVPAHANLFVAKWRVVGITLDHERRMLTRGPADNRIREQTQGVEWVQFRLNDREDDIDIVQPVGPLRQRGFERGAAFCANERVRHMNQSFTPPVPFNAERSEWADVNHFDGGRIATLKYVFNAQTRLYEWTAMSPLIAAERRQLSEASLARTGSDWIIAARSPGVGWIRCEDPFREVPAMTFAREPSMGAPLTVFTCADDVLRLFGGSAAVSPHRNARDPLYMWDIDPRHDFAASNRRVIFDSVAEGLRIRPRAVPKIDMCKLLPPVGRTQMLVFRVSVRSYNFPYTSGNGVANGIPAINDDEKQACGIYAARITYSEDMRPTWSF